jgi:hypothetical protein
MLTRHLLKGHCEFQIVAMQGRRARGTRGADIRPLAAYDSMPVGRLLGAPKN